MPSYIHTMCAQVTCAVRPAEADEGRTLQAHCNLQQRLLGRRLPPVRPTRLISNLHCALALNSRSLRPLYQAASCNDGATAAATVVADVRERRRDRARPSRGISFSGGDELLLVGSALVVGRGDALAVPEVDHADPSRCGQHWSEWGSSSVDEANAVTAIAPSDQIWGINEAGVELELEDGKTSTYNMYTCAPRT